MMLQLSNSNLKAENQLLHTVFNAFAFGTQHFGLHFLIGTEFKTNFWANGIWVKIYLRFTHSQASENQSRPSKLFRLTNGKREKTEPFSLHSRRSLININDCYQPIFINIINRTDNSILNLYICFRFWKSQMCIIQLYGEY